MEKKKAKGDMTVTVRPPFGHPEIGCRNSDEHRRIPGLRIGRRIKDMAR